MNTGECQYCHERVTKATCGNCGAPTGIVEQVNPSSVPKTVVASHGTCSQPFAVYIASEIIKGQPPGFGHDFMTGVVIPPGRHGS